MRAKNDESTDTLEEDVIHTTRRGDLTSPGFDDLFFPALGDARLEKDDAPRTDPSANEASPRTTTALRQRLQRRPSSRPKYLIGLTTSAGFGDQFKRVSTYAAMARELNRTLVMWPVFTSPHYDLGGSGPDARGPLFFDLCTSASAETGSPTARTGSCRIATRRYRDACATSRCHTRIRASPATASAWTCNFP